MMSSKGFSLVQVLIAIAISGILLVSITEMINMSIRLERSININSDINDTISLIRMYLQKPSLCTIAMGGGSQRYNAQNFSIYDPTDTPAPNSPRKVLASAGMTKNGWTVQTVSIDSTNAVNPGNWVGSIQLTINRNSYIAVGGSVTKRSIPIELSTDATGNIINCSSLGLGVGGSQFKLQMAPVASMHYKPPVGTVGNYSRTLTSTCPQDYVVLQCLTCTGQGCTPSLISYDSNTSGGKTNNNLYDADFNQYYKFVSADGRTCTYIRNWTFPAQNTDPQAWQNSDMWISMAAQCISLL